MERHFLPPIAANCVSESTRLMALATGVQCLMLQALQASHEPFADFVHAKKPHAGQVWTAKIVKQLLQEGCDFQPADSKLVQDRYSLRCLPQYMGSIVEGVARVSEVVETEMNSVSDNPLIDAAEGTFYQSGNFLGQYVALAMDDLRKFIGLMAKHLDVQIAALVTPEFNAGLPPSLRGNGNVSYNMGLKGLQITGNSIMPLLTWYGHSIVDQFPTHAEQFNQNINGLSWGSANLAWKSVELFQHYLAVSTVFAVQALDLRAHATLGHYDGRALLGTLLTPVYEAACASMNHAPDPKRPLLFNDCDLWLEQSIAELHTDIAMAGKLAGSVAPILDSFEEEFQTSCI